MNYAFSCAVSVALCKSEYCLGFFLPAFSSLIKHNISTQMKSAYSKREQDDQGKTMRESTVTPASAGRVAGWGRQTRDGDNKFLLTGWWTSDKGKVMSQVTKVSKWASAEDRAGHGPILDVSQARSRTRGPCAGAEDGGLR